MRNLRGYLIFLAFGGVLTALPVRADLFACVQRPDPAFRWEKGDTRDLVLVSLTDLHVTSQVWEGITWEHRLRILRPKQIEFPNTAVLVITGGDGSEEENAILGAVADAAGMVLAILYNIPNQPLFGDLREDDLIAHTFVRYLETGDEDWPLLFPMTKSAVRAMDALQAFANQEWQQEIERFVVTGASKRGWTTWLTAVVDPRVAGIVPMVYDNLNLVAQMPHQIETWGAYSAQIDEYTRRGLQQQMATERGRQLAEMVDPYTYKDRLTMPKLIINGTNDPYWTLDALNLYWDDLPGQKCVLYVPNSGHELEDTARVINTAVEFARAVAGHEATPRLTWRYEDVGGEVRLTLASEPRPREARLWIARSDSQDFRDSQWEQRPMSQAEGEYAGEIMAPDTGFLALFGEAVYETGGRSFTLSTQIRIVGAGS